MSNYEWVKDAKIENLANLLENIEQGDITPDIDETWEDWLMQEYDNERK